MSILNEMLSYQFNYLMIVFYNKWLRQCFKGRFALLESIPIALPPARVAASIPLDVSSKIQISSFKRVELRGRACRQLRKSQIRFTVRYILCG